MFTRFNGNVVPFADDATSTNRTVFGGTTQSDLIDDNLNTNFKKGWEIVGLNDNPTREDFNAMGYTLGALTAYLYEMGISEWNASQNYRANSRVTGSDGKIYKSLTGTTGIPNVGNNPITNAVNWAAEEAEKSVVYSALTAKTTPVDADLIAIADSTSSFSLKKLTWANLKATLKTYFDTLYLALTGAQTVDGVKTFISSPIVPTQTAQDNSTKIATTAYVDGKMVLGTAVNTTSGTAFDFTGIPSWVKRITLIFNDMSQSGGDDYLIQLGTSTGIVTTGYSSLSIMASTNAATGGSSSTAGMHIISQGASNSEKGTMTINKLDNNTWVSTHIIQPGSAGVRSGAGRIILSGVLTTVRLTRSGTNTFDNGRINIMYEG